MVVESLGAIPLICGVRSAFACGARSGSWLFLAYGHPDSKRKVKATQTEIEIWCKHLCEWA